MMPADVSSMASAWGVVAAALCLTASTMHAQESAGTAAQDRQAPVVLVTGSTDGLGREVARRLAATGAHVIVHGRNRERGEALVREIERAGRGRARFYAADLASLAEVRAFAESVLRDYDRLDALVNNAGIWLEREDGRQVSLTMTGLP